MALKIFKFQDKTDFNSAFIVAETMLDARDHILKETALEIVFVESKDLEDFPKAIKGTTPPYIFINKILPF